MGDGNSSGDERADDLRRRDPLRIVARMMEKQTAAFMAALAKKELAVIPTDLSTAGGSGLQSVATGGNSMRSISSTTGTASPGVQRSEPIIGDEDSGDRRSHRGRGEARMGGDILEPFDPDEADSNVERWVSKIDQLGEIYGGSLYERAYFALLVSGSITSTIMNSLGSNGRRNCRRRFHDGKIMASSWRNWWRGESYQTRPWRAIIMQR
ncbi:hypothetical protein QE152_g5601 [Popillia japonica]|uniref:Uncharacterized protein n=1 Tax=Popillia japonica TaxID=7064 RepID=A0AAW1MND6_POPJA